MTVIADPFENIEVETEAPKIPAPRRTGSPAAIKFAVDLMERKLGVDREVAQRQAEALEPRALSQAIDKLKFMRDLPKPPAADAVTEDGMYRHPETGEIFKVQRAVHGSGNLYAKVLVIDRAWERNAEGKVVVEGKAHFEYAPGALKNLKASWKLTLEQAKQFGSLYGVCIRCAATLTKEESIERAMGDTCAGKF